MDIPAFPKTWIICHGAGLTDGSIRTELKRGFQPWNARARTLWVLNLENTPIGILSVEEARAEWRACMKYWISVTVENAAIEIFDHQENGINQLRVRLTKRMHFCNVVSHLRGFVHPISELCYNQLLALGYQHIFRNNINGVISYYLIFGPITIARKDPLSRHIMSSIPVRMLMIFQFGCGQVYHDEESWEDGFKYYDGVSLKIEEEEWFREDAMVNYFERTDLELMKTTVIFVIYMHEFDDKYYDEDDEITFRN